MTIVYNQNFDGVTVPALPSGWIGTGGSTWTTTTADALSSPNALIGAGDGTNIIETAYSALADMMVRYDLANVGNSSGGGFIAPILRSSSDGTTCYLFYPEYGGTVNNTWTLYKCISGTFTAVTTFALSGKTGTGSTNSDFSVRAEVKGTTLAFKIWGYGATEPGSYDFTTSDSSISAAGYPGLRYQFPASGSATVVADNFTLDNTIASSLSISPSSVTANSSGNILTLTGVGTSWTAGTPGSPTFTVSGGTITAQTVTSATSATLTYSAPSSAGAVTITDPSTSNTATLAINAAAATDFSLTPSTQNATVDNPSPAYTVAPNGTPSSTLTIALTDGGAGGTFKNSGGTAITSLTFTTSAARTFTYTPASTGTKTLTATPSGAGLTTAYTATCVASTGPLVIPITSASLFWSPGNWDHLTSGTFDVATDTMQATAPGAYLKFQVTGTTTLSLSLDNATTSGFPSGDMPVLRYSLNGGAFTDVQLAPSQTSLVLSASLTPTTTYSVELYFRQSSQTNSYGDVAGSSGVSPTNVVRINGVTIDGSASVSPATLRPKRMLIYGDSITQGCHANTDGSDDATVSFACDIALALGAEYGQLGYGGSGWTVSGGSNAPAFDTFYATHSIGRSRSFAGLDYIAVIHGGNDLRGGVAGSAIQSACGAWLTAMRAAAGPSTILFVIVECMGAYEGNLSAAVAAYKASSGDANVCFIDATSLFPAGVFSIAFNYSGNPFQWTYDGVHPLAFGHARIGAAYAKQIGAAMGGGTTLAGYSRARVVNG